MTEPQQRRYRYVDIITASFVAVLLISNVAALKLFTLWGRTFDGGAFIFPISYIFGDILTEVYG
ncbi:MAG: VUT family protein, partial [Proteobacteria bacterium]|nr:VUT family protein [Pseudomonadota bacterium]